MYRVMIIDDEQSSRNLLKVAVNWAELSMEVVGEAASGIEAINIIDELHPDIAFVDISMPFMDGIEFTKIVTERYHDLYVIILTAFDDFECARQCVRLPVFDYMLKPIVRDDLSETLLNLKEALDSKHASDISESPRETGAQPDSSIDIIKKYINDNLENPALNLTLAAQELGFSPSYLSRKFKQESGINFIEYLTSCRIKKSLKMALDGQKMFAAAQAVGIPDPNYFGKCFKKYMGKSYSEYQACQKAQ